MRNEKRRFRPMGVLDILDETIDLYKRNFVLLVGTAAVLYVPISTINSIVQDPMRQKAQINWVSIVLIMIEALVTGALTFGISERYLGKPVSIADCYKRVCRKDTVLPFIIAMAIKYLVVLSPLFWIAAMAASIPQPRPGANIDPQLIRQTLTLLGLMFISLIWMLCFGIKFMLVESAVVLESCGAWRALARSWTLTGRNFWKGFSIYFILILVFGIIFGLLAGPLIFARASSVFRGEEVSRWVVVLAQVITVIIGTLSIPIMAAARILFYYDTRIRKEGFDLEMLAQELDRKNRQVPAGDVRSLPQERVHEPETEGEME